MSALLGGRNAAGGPGGAAMSALLEAAAPPEARGVARDAVRLLVARRGDGAVAHHRFRELPELLAPGDLLVVNDSATLPAAIAAEREDGTHVELRLSTAAPGMPDGWWIVELRSEGGLEPLGGGAEALPPNGADTPIAGLDDAKARGAATTPGAAPWRARKRERIALAGGATAELIAPYLGSARLWRARIDSPLPLYEHLARHGRPIRYAYVPEPWPLADYQTAFARTPGSAEMPSAARPFTPELIARLVAGGVLVAPITLHTGVSSPERHEPPYPERYAVPAATARLVNAVRAWGGRVIATGTTTVRALESAADEHGTVSPSEGWTDLVITPARGVRAVDGLISGWHEPEASHLLMLEAIAGAELLDRSYAAARAEGYLWHEFGDSHLILP